MTPRAREFIALILGLGVCAVLAAPAAGIPIVLDMKSKSFDQLGASAVVAGPLTEAFEHEMLIQGQLVTTFSGTVTSEVFSRTDGRYLYLYQAVNDGPSVLEEMTVLPFYALDADDAGAAIGVVPAPFQAGGLLPYGAVYESDVPGAPTVAYNYHSVLGAALPAGEKTAVLYLISPNPPVLGEAHVIDTGVDHVPAWVAEVPEPATLGLLSAGLMASLIRKRRRA